MSQEKVFDILVELEGEASTAEIRDKAKKKYPDRTLHTYVSDRLHKLEKWGYISSHNQDNQEIWKIEREYP